MSIDEWIVLLVTGAYAAYGWARWYMALGSIWPAERGRRSRLWLQWMPMISVSFLLVVLGTLASFDVVGDSIYTLFYVVLGLAWLALVRDLFFLLFDLSWRDDAIERNNPAAVLSVFGALFGATAIYAGSNVGDGPGWWVVVFAGGFATVMWLALLGAKQLVGKVFEKVTVGRDYAASVRLSCYMIASGLVLGRSAAGDWISAQQTVAEFVYAWPVLLLTVIAIIVDRLQSTEALHGAPDDKKTRDAWLWGIGYIVMAVGLLVLFPAMTQNPWYGR